MKKKIAILAAMLVLVLATPAEAVSFVDKDEGGVSHLDIRLSTRTNTSLDEFIYFSIETYDGWRLSYCFQANCSIEWRLNTRSGPALDRVAYWYAIHQAGIYRPVCEVYNLRTGSFIGYGQAWKVRHQAGCRFSKVWLNKTHDIRWMDQTTAVNDHDRAPDVGFYGGANE